MKSTSARQSQDLLRDKIQKSFAEFNRRSSPSRGRRYTSDLRNLVCQARQAGLSLVEIQRLSGMSKSAVGFALGKTAIASKHQDTRPIVRQLKVVPSDGGNLRTEDHVKSYRPKIVVRLPSGACLEFDDACCLSSELLVVLMGKGLADAASR